ncbi:hypothetical protein AB0N65_11885 [Paenarthrobacter sp. NPDC089322]|uniref:hypothetical protein n=1 Tax=Paenarthrobacter sp. NPDC089322 TaxID=3155065 RepID=UPI00341D320A
MTDIREVWMNSVVGTALNPDGRYGFQCVDAVDHFGEFIFGVPWPECVGGVAGANGLLDRAPDKYWERIDYYHGFVPQRWDVGVTAGDNLNQWGHTFIIESADWTGMNVIQQDGFAYPWQFVDGNYYSAKPAHRARLAYSHAGTGPLLGVLRARPHMLIGGGESINPQSSTPTEEDDMFTDLDRERLNWLWETASAGRSGYKEAGSVAADAARAAAAAEAVLDAVSPGESGKRHAGAVYAAIESLKATNATVNPTELARALAAALPPELAKQVVSELGTALGGK